MTSCLRDNTVKNDDVGALAESVMSILANRSQVLEHARLEQRASELLAALRPSDADTLSTFLRRSRHQGVTDAHLIDCVIPEAARQLGRDWVADRMGFETVSLMSLRLQSLLHETNARFILPDPTAGRTVLLCLMPGERHRLGARVIESALMRQGYATRIIPSADEQTLRDALASQDCGAVLFSCSQVEAAREADRILRRLRAQMTLPLTIMGGLLVELEPELEASLTVDLLTNDFETAVSRMNRAVVAAQIHR